MESALISQAPEYGKMCSFPYISYIKCFIVFSFTLFPFFFSTLDLDSIST